ncbi:MAG: hypothetical protein IPG10_19015 [Flavobacteriales bacterium]|nr:hypothetical protein [Flavobacteriales bacterium]
MKTIDAGLGVKLGSFLGTVVDSRIIAFVISPVAKALDKMKKAELVTEPRRTTEDQKLLMEHP